VAACKKSQPPEPPRAKPIAADAPTPNADKAIAEGEQDPSWIAGTWKKDGEWRWLLFNLPADAVELAGNPARVARKGKVSIHGNFVSVVFENAALDLEANQEHAQLVASSGGGGYRRGAPP
jgi:hypothetical protein